MKKLDFRCLAWLLLLYIIARLPIILSYTDTYHLELYRGILAKEWMEGFRLPWGDYVVDPYALAPLFNGLLTIPFFLIAGEILFALKLLPFFWHLLSLMVWFFLWRSFFPLQQAFLISLFLILAPPNIVEYTVTNHGYHFDTILWTALSLLVMQRMFSKKFSVLQGGSLLGLLGGFSTSLCLTNFVTVFVILLYMSWTLASRRKEFYFTYGFLFVVGLSFWLIFNAHHGWEGLNLPRSLFSLFSLGVILDNLPEAFSALFFSWGLGLKSLLTFRNMPRFFTPILTYGYELIYLFSLIFLVAHRIRSWKNISNRFDIEIFGLFYQIVLLTLALFMFSINDGRYLFPMAPFMGMTIVSAVQMAKPILKYGALSFCITAGLIGDFTMIHWNEIGKTFSIPGYSYMELGQVLQTRFYKNPKLFWEKARILMKDRPQGAKEAFHQAIIDPDLVKYENF